MSDVMMFPETVEEFMEDFKIVDTEQVYTNGMELVPIFRMEQWFDAHPQRKKGKWVIHPEVKHMYGGIYIECSECHTKYVVQHIDVEKYCRNCGAEMEV